MDIYVSPITDDDIRGIYDCLPKKEVVEIAIEKTKEIWKLRREIEKLKSV